MAKSTSDPARGAWPFLALFVLVGLGFLTPFVLQAIRDYRIAKVYQTVECKITARRTVTGSSSSRLGSSWVTHDYSHTEFTWNYRVNGQEYVAEGYDNHDGIMADPNEAGNLTEGVTVQGWFDPAAPEKSVLARNFQPKFYLGALIPGSFVLIGGTLLAGVLRRSPRKVKLGATKGERLGARLHPVLSTRGIMGCLGTMATVLALFIFLVLPKVGVASASPSLIGGKGWLYIFCLAIEGFLLYHLFRAVRASQIPDPIVEIDAESLHPGQTSRLFIRMPGPAKLTAIQVQVICEKTGRSGTRTAYKQRVLEKESVQIGLAEEFEESFAIPAKASKSSETVQTATHWCIRIRRKLANGISFDTDYPFGVGE
jgi:hypothetical protein